MNLEKKANSIVTEISKHINIPSGEGVRHAIYMIVLNGLNDVLDDKRLE